MEESHDGDYVVVVGGGGGGSGGMVIMCRYSTLYQTSSLFHHISGEE
jgi:hypothetical protein